MAQRVSPERLALLRQHDNGVPWTWIAAESGVPVRTLARWAAQNHTVLTSRGLKRIRRADHGTMRILSGRTDAVTLSESCVTAAALPTRYRLTTVTSRLKFPGPLRKSRVHSRLTCARNVAKRLLKAAEVGAC